MLLTVGHWFTVQRRWIRERRRRGKPVECPPVGDHDDGDGDDGRLRQAVLVEFAGGGE